MPTESEAAVAAPANKIGATSIYASATLWLLMLVAMMNFLDRQVVYILAEPIKRDLHLTDAQIGMMTGLVFAVFYTLLGIPIARLTDRPATNRVSLVAGCLALWSTMTAFCGLGQTFGHLLAARIGVGVGEAGCTPAAHSLISDSYPVEERPAAMAFYGLGLPLGILVGMSLGGGIAEAFGWRTAFLALGVPGILLATIVYFVVPEPRRRAPKMEPRGPRIQDQSPSLRIVLREIFNSRAFVLLVAAVATSAFLAFGRGAWHAVFFMRSHGLGPGVAGLTLGLIGGLGTGVGTWAGGALASRFGSVDRRHMVTAPAIGFLLAMPFSLAAYTVGDWRLAAVLLLAGAVSNGLGYGPIFTCVQGLVSPGSRGTATAVFLLIENLLGLGLGPLVFGALSDEIRPWAGQDSVRYVLFMSILLAPIPALCLWRAGRHLNRELRA